jgi:uncharacterized repeat protein (TIGR01451 family)
MKITRYMLAFIIVIFINGFAQQYATLEIDNLDCMQLDQVSIPVYMTNNFAVGGFTLLILTNPYVMDLIEINYTSRLNNGNEYRNWTPDAEGPGSDRIIWTANMNDSIYTPPALPGNGAILMLNYAIYSDCYYDINSAIRFYSFDPSDNTITDSSGYTIIMPTLINGNIHIGACRHNKGDVNLNNYPYDAGDLDLLQARLYNGNSVFTINPGLQECASDLNGNSFADIADFNIEMRTMIGIPMIDHPYLSPDDLPFPNGNDFGERDSILIGNIDNSAIYVYPGQIIEMPIYAKTDDSVSTVLARLTTENRYVSQRYGADSAAFISDWIFRVGPATLAGQDSQLTSETFVTVSCTEESSYLNTNGNAIEIAYVSFQVSQTGEIGDSIKAICNASYAFDNGAVFSPEIVVSPIIIANITPIPGSLSGIVRNSSSQPAAGAIVGIENANRFDTTDSFGRYQIDDIFPGQYIVDFSLTSMADTFAQARIMDGDTTTLDMTMRLIPSGVRAWFGNLDGTPIIASTGSAHYIDVFAATWGAAYIDFLHLCLGGRTEYINSFEENLFSCYYPFSLWDDCSILPPEGSPPNSEGWSSQSFLGILDIGGGWGNPPFHSEQPIGIMRFATKFNPANINIGDTLLCFGPGRNSEYGAALAGQEGIYSYGIEEHFSPVYFTPEIGYLEGTVLDEYSAPIENVIVSHTQDLFNNTTDASGRFHFDQLLPGAYSLKFSAPGLSDTTLSNLQVVVGDTTMVNMTMYRNSIIAGNVRRSDNMAPIWGSLVKLGSDYSVTSNQQGQFIFPAIPHGTYNLNGSKTGFSERSIESITALPGETLNVDISLDPLPTDLRILLWSEGTPRPGFNKSYLVEYENLGVYQCTNTIINMILPEEVTYLSSTPYGSLRGDTIQWQLGTIEGLAAGSVRVFVNVPVYIQNGTELNCFANISTSDPEEVLTNNSDTEIEFVVNSWDPNDKQANPLGKSAARCILPEENIKYTIFFENIGTGEAVNIAILDTLDAKLDWSSIKFGPMSHPESCTPFFDYQTGIIRWDCDSIMLVPNNTPPEGEGWVTFEVNPLPNLQNNSKIQNRASIRFDFNPWIYAPMDSSYVIRTIDIQSPQSEVIAARITPTSDTIKINWYGSDGNSGAGIERFQIYVSIDSAGYGLIGEFGATQHELLYQAELRRCYDFYSIAIDSVGNAELAPTYPDASICLFSCFYLPGDANSNDAFNGLDVTYSVNYFKGIGNPPQFSCECTPGNTWYVAGDVNASCSFNGLDVTYMVNYFKGGAGPIPCADCSPPGFAPPSLSVQPIKEPAFRPDKNQILKSAE